MPKKCQKTSLSQKGWCNKPTKLQFQSILTGTIFMLSKRYEPTEVDRRTWLHVPSGTPWSTSSDTHQVVGIRKETSTYLYTNNRDFLSIRTFLCKNIKRIQLFPIQCPRVKQLLIKIVLVVVIKNV